MSIGFVLSFSLIYAEMVEQKAGVKLREGNFKWRRDILSLFTMSVLFNLSIFIICATNFLLLYSTPSMTFEEVNKYPSNKLLDSLRQSLQL